jgi:hypothetical protein
VFSVLQLVAAFLQRGYLQGDILSIILYLLALAALGATSAVYWLRSPHQTAASTQKAAR